MGLDQTAAVPLALSSAAALAVLHLLAPRIRRLPPVPELDEGGDRLREVLGEEGPRSPLLGLEIFLVALVGFTTFHGLERLAERRRAADREGEVFRLHLGAFVVYNAIIGYALPLSWRTSVVFALLFTVAMGRHFVLSDRGLGEHYGRRFDRSSPRLVLAGAVLGGWALAATVVPTSGVVVSLLTAFLAGSILLNVFKEELPSTRRSHFGWFVIGLAGYAVLLWAATAAGA